MGLLSFFKKQDQEQNEDKVYRTILIKKLLEDVEDMKKRFFNLENDLKELKKNNNIAKQQIQRVKKLSKLELNIYNIYIDKKPKSIETLSKQTNIKIESLRVYLSRIRSKGHIIEFN